MRVQTQGPQDPQGPQKNTKNDPYSKNLSLEPINLNLNKIVFLKNSRVPFFLHCPKSSKGNKTHMSLFTSNPFLSVNFLPH